MTRNKKSNSPNIPKQEQHPWAAKSSVYGFSPRYKSHCYFCVRQVKL